MSKKNDKEFDGLIDDVTDVMAENQTKAKSTQYFIYILTIFQRMAVNRIVDLRESIAKLKIFLWVEMISFVLILSMSIFGFTKCMEDFGRKMETRLNNNDCIMSLEVRPDYQETEMETLPWEVE